jgi:hypothetical protein
MKFLYNSEGSNLWMNSKPRRIIYAELLVCLRQHSAGNCDGGPSKATADPNNSSYSEHICIPKSFDAKGMETF